MNAAKKSGWALAAGLAILTGCQTQSTTKQPATAAASSTREDVMDVRPMPGGTPTYQPQSVQPIAYQPPVQPVQSVAFDSPATPAVSSTPTAGSTHVVKHGETLYSIAKASYGDGKKWQQIASANPGVSPSSLKVGQSLIIP